ncbi:MAG: superoxide dismutase [Bacteroidales bacterium]|nr:superoxide dismutase [Bacteroidales bacterium]
MFTLMQLPYALDALEPVISKQTLEFHHGKHLQAYVDNLNKLLPGSGLEGLSLEEIVARAEGGLFNNAGQVLNHEMYFEQFSPLPVRKAPSGDFLEAIKKQWVTLDAFMLEFEMAGASVFGSGWVWLQADADGELSIGKYVGADNPVAHGLKPLLTFDVWEHAYYLDYQNRRPEYLHKLWDLLDWNVVQQRYR